MIDNRTPNLLLPLPHAENSMQSDVQRLIDSLTALDAAVYAKSDSATVNTLVATAVANLVASAPGTLDTLKELADALGNDPNFATSITTALAGKLPNAPATSTTLGGVKVGSGLTVAVDGTLSAVAADGGGSGLPAWEELQITPSSNGQTTFAVSGGYQVGQLDVYLNGVILYPNGNDYTASDGSNFVLTSGVTTADTLLVRRWFYLPAATTVNKAGDTMSGYLNVPTNATGTAAPQVQEVVKKSGDTMSGALTLSADPTAALHAATKQYVDSLASGLDAKPSVKAASTANIASLSGPMTVDGIALVAGDRILVKDQSAGNENGIYVVAAGAWSRAADSDTWSELVSAFTIVEQGTVNADTGWVCTGDVGGTLGSTSVVWVKFVGGLMSTSGGTFTGAISVPAGASGPQAPQVQEVLKKSGGQLTGTVSFTETDLGAGNAIDWAVTNDFKKTISSAWTPTFSNPTGPAKLTLKVTVSGATRTITWPASVVFPTGSLSSSFVVGVWYFTFLWDGSKYRGGILGPFAS